MSTDLLYFDYTTIPLEENMALPGMHKFSYFYRIYSNGVMFLDRTGTIVSPIRTKSVFPMPKMQTTSKHFEETCHERAREILTKADMLGTPLYAFWSGGIDSTCMLVSLLKSATPEQKKNIVVVMSDNSIHENPNFFENHIRGKLRTEPGYMAPYLLLGTRNLVVNGEHNDQLFGSDMVAKLIDRYGGRIVHQPYNRSALFGLFDTMTKDPDMTNFYLDIFERLKGAAPMTLTTNHDILWWINFCLKWQLVHLFVWIFASDRNVVNMNRDMLSTYYMPFYATDDFQLWSMNNLDKRIKDTWKSYKWVCKDIIYDYTKDAEYRDHKTKFGSRYFLLLNQIPFKKISSSFNFSRNPMLREYHEQKNDFL